MAIYEDDGYMRSSLWSNKWATVTAVVVGVVAVAIAAVLVAGAQLANSPMAIASTTQATPWVPLPHFAPIHPKQPQSSVRSQGDSKTSGAEDKGSGWVSKATKPFNTINAQMKSLYQAFGAQDIPAVQSACRGLSGAGQDLAATLPAPNDQLTAESQGLIDEIAGLSSACLADPPDTAAMQTHGTGVATHMENLAKLING